MRTTSSTSIEDPDGHSPEYELHKYPASEGFDLSLELSEIAAGPLGQLMDSSSGEEALGSLLDVDISGAKAGAAASLLVRGIMQRDGSKFAHRILRYTTRDNVKMSNVKSFDKAYQGNYGELMSALMWVIRENFGGVLKKLTNPFAQGSLPTAS